MNDDKRNDESIDIKIAFWMLMGVIIFLTAVTGGAILAKLLGL